MTLMTLKLVVLLITSSSLLRADGIPDDVATGLRANAADLTPIEVTWTYRRRALISESRLTSDFGVTDFSLFGEHTSNTVLLDGSKISQMTRWPQNDENGNVTFQVRETTFDQDYWYSGTGVDEVKARGANPVLQILRLADVRETLMGNLFLLDYFANAGFLVSQTAAQLGSDPSSIVLNAQSPTRTVACVPENIDAEQCQKVTTTDSAGSITWWLSQSKNYAVVRTEHVDADGILHSRTENSEFAELGDRNIWLPKRIDHFWYRWRENDTVSETPVVVEEFRVTSVSHADVSADRFVLKYDAPGTFVSDAKLADEMKLSKDEVDYQVAAKQADLDRAIGQAAQGKGYRPSRQGLPSVLLAVNGLLLATLVSWLVLRRYRKGRR